MLTISSGLFVQTLPEAQEAAAGEAVVEAPGLSQIPLGQVTTTGINPLTGGLTAVSGPASVNPLTGASIGNQVGTLPTLDNYVLAGGPNVINLLRVPGEQQIMLRVTVAEIDRTAARSIGMNFSILKQRR